jgi:hypothetical protein
MSVTFTSFRWELVVLTNFTNFAMVKTKNKAVWEIQAMLEEFYKSTYSRLRG